MPWVEVQGTDVSCVEEGSGPPLLFLHGNSSCGEAWFQQFAATRDRYHVIAHDSVNHGHSSNSPRDAEEPDRVDDLEGVIAALGLVRPVIAGNSMGANTLLRWATRHPAEATALIPSGMGIMDAGATAPRAPDPLAAETLFLPTGDSLTEGFKVAQPRMYERYLRIRSTATRIEALCHPRRPSARTLAERGALDERAAAIRSPMLIVVGTLDRLLEPARRLHAAVAGSELVEIEGAPHNVYYEAAEAYNAAVARFLARVAAPAGAR
ncbi:MAG: alpha/beta hydrolase [Chloroflexi bacterium]|nr:alpha/beta hydrolase [Chloroflexota bacterium]